MTKTSPKTYMDMGFIKEMFSGAEDLSAFLKVAIDEQAGLLSDRIGEARYNSSVASIGRQVTRAEKCLVAAELCRLRKVKLVGVAKANGEEAKTTELNTQIKDYKDEAELWIGKVLAGSTSDADDFASGALVTDHFGGTDA